MITIHALILGPLENNTYLLGDDSTGEAALVDPSFELEHILDVIEEHEYRLRYILLTHAHFDHIVNAQVISDRYSPTIPLGLHPSDLSLWTSGGGADLFGVDFKPTRQPDLHFYASQKIKLGKEEIEVRHTPGHTPGSVCFVLPSNQTVLTGDLIFYRSVGRTDLQGGDTRALIRSIEGQIFTLPPAYHIRPGHGPATTVREEIDENPFF